VAGEERTLVIDTMMTKNQATILAERATQLGKGTPKIVLNTHRHGDHVFGNQVFRDSIILSHRSVREHVIAEWTDMVEFTAGVHPELGDELRALTLTPPTFCLDAGAHLDLGKRNVEILYHGQAHSEGDLAVFLADEGILFTGDLVVNGAAPFIFPYADIENWEKILAEFETLPVSTIVPGHGAVCGPQQIGVMKDYVSFTNAKVTQCVKVGMSMEETIEQAKYAPVEGWYLGPFRHTENVKTLYTKMRETA
jgi:cyclase